MTYDSVFKAELFAGQCVLVTGGGSGLGEATARRLAAGTAHTVGRRPATARQCVGLRRLAGRHPLEQPRVAERRLRPTGLPRGAGHQDHASR